MRSIKRGGAVAPGSDEPRRAWGAGCAGRWMWTVVAALAVAACDGEAFKTDNSVVEEGNEALSAGRGEEALKAYDEAVKEIPEDPALHYDRGMALSELGRHDDATQELLRATGAHDRALRQRVFAALGTAYARWALALENRAKSGAATKTSGAAGGKLAGPGGGGASAPGPGAPPGAAPDRKPGDAKQDDAKVQAKAAMDKWQHAVEHLDHALTLDPSDEASRQTLEVALARVDPPCKARDDDMEPNQGEGQAAEIKLSKPQATQSGAPAPDQTGDVLTWHRQLMSCPEDPDVFRLKLQPGDRLEAHVEGDPAQGRLALHLHAPGAPAASASANPAGKPPAQGDVQTRVSTDVGASGGGDYFLRVDNVDLGEVPYALDVKVRPACERTEDRFEDNDDPAHAKTVTPGPLPGLKLCPGDPDWFAVTLAEGESLFVYATPAQKGDDDDEGATPEAASHPKAPNGSLSLTITDEAGTFTDHGGPTGEGAQAGRVASLLTPGEGRYLIGVSGAAGLEERYDLTVRVIPPCPAGDDEYEDNDIPEDATVVNAGQAAPGAAPGQAAPGAASGQPAGGGSKPGEPMFLRICPGDPDWFQVDVQPDKPVVVSAIFEHRKGDLSLTQFDATGQDKLARSDASSPTRNGEALTLQAPEPPKPAQGGGGAPGGSGASSTPPASAAPSEPVTYTLKVQGTSADTQNFYLLEVKQPKGGGDKNNKDKNNKDKNKDKDKDKKKNKDKDKNKDKGKDKQRKPKEPKPQPLEDALDKLDHNPENLEAQRAEQRSPLSQRPPRKDW